MTYNYKCDNINTVIKKIQKRGEKEMVRFKIVATGKNVVTGKDADVTVEYTVTNNELELINRFSPLREQPVYFIYL